MRIINEGNKKMLQIKGIMEEGVEEEKDLSLKVQEIISEYIEWMEDNEERIKI